MTPEAQALYNQAEQLFNDKNYQAVIDLLTDEVLQQHNSGELYFGRGLAKKNLGQHEEAIKDYNEAIRLDPEYAATYNNRGITKNNLGQHEEAIKDYNKAIRINPEYTDAYYNRGLSKNKLGQHEEAIKDYNEAIRLKPEDVYAYNNRGLSKNELGQHEEAIKDYNKAIHINPEYANAYNNRGVSKDKLGQHKEAIKDYNKAISINPQDAFTYNNRGISKKNLGQYEEAIKDYNEAIRLNPEHANAYNNRGVTKKNLRKYKEAIKDFDVAIRLEPNGSLRYRNKGEALEKLNRFDEALVCYQKTIELKPNDSYAKQLLDDLRLRLSLPPLEGEERHLLLNIIKLVDDVANKVKVGDDYINTCHIAHYTKLFVADAVLTKKVDKKELETNPNLKVEYDDTRTLRYYNASYMNDPTEGMVLLDFLNDNEITDAFNLAALGQESTIYLGSFVEVNYNSPANSHDDNLFLWRTYGKDETGIEGAGCCMVFDDTFFDKHSDNDNTRTTPKQALHKVFYIDRATKAIETQIPLNAKSKEKNRIEKLSKDLKKALETLGGLIKDLINSRKTKTKNEKELDENKKVNEFIYQQLSRIRFFFKSADYKYESELRIVHEAPMDSDLIYYDIRNEGKTKLLYVNSNRPVIGHLKKIVLGPKVPNPDQWIYLSSVVAQYYKAKNIKDRKFELRRSKSPFR